MITQHILLIIACLAASAFFSGIETGIISIHRLRLRHFVRQGSRSAGILESFVEDFDRLLGTTLVGNNLCLVVMSVAAASLSAYLQIPGGKAVSSAVIVIIVIVFGEYLPKAWFQAHPIERCRRFAHLLKGTEWLLRPLAVSIIAIARLLSPGQRDKTFSRPAPFVSREDLKILAREGEINGVLSAKERYMIHRVIELSNLTAANIMIPRTQIISVFEDSDMDSFFAMARETGLIRFPVISRKTGAFTGIVNVISALSAREGNTGKTVADFARPANPIPASMPADRILPNMRRARQPMALIRNGDGVVGLVTTEDILRIIVGKL